MISGSPSLLVSSLSSPPEPKSTGIDGFLSRYANEYWYYGSGKVALRDGLSAFAGPDETVLLPSYLPDGVAEPVRDLGLEPRYYAIDPDLSPDLADLESRIDERTTAVLSVDYFGFPQPGLADLRGLVEEYDCYHVDDNAHAPLSLDGDTLLGTRGHVGITSLWKLLPIPNGAVLYVNDGSVADRFDPSGLAEPNDRLAARDYLFVLKSLATDALDSHAAIRRSVDALVFDRGDSTVAEPSERYEASKTPMSHLSARVVDSADLDGIRAARRENYRTWRRILIDRADVEFLFPDLPRGICPQVCPVRTEAPQRFRRELERCGVGGVYTWPRLPAVVRGDPAYETATRLSQELLALPVHQHVDVETLESVGRRLSRQR